MKLNEIRDNDYARKNRKRVGRGIGSGTGKTSGKGHKGQKSRSGVAIKGFEGGQMPLHRRLPKHGFNNIFRKKYSIINIGNIQSLIESGKINNKVKINADSLLNDGIMSKLKDGIKLLGNGELKSKIDIEVSVASNSAIKAVEALGGNISIIKNKKELENKK
ncbi:MAG: 50S ribosomal protein L15 [Pelagibacterales bacterium]|nr:50S ribosomal protein L15 [Pelagibacterales bacterium]|tara:strand:+ start:71 stop:556 length:486 start_codon:yes stop_codon:yes gene_type:complete